MRYLFLCCLVVLALAGFAFTQDSPDASSGSLIDIISAGRHLAYDRNSMGNYDIDLLNEAALAELQEARSRRQTLQNQIREHQRGQVQGDAATLNKLAAELRSISQLKNAAELTRVGKDFIALRSRNEEFLIPVHRIGRVSIQGD